MDVSFRFHTDEPENHIAVYHSVTVKQDESGLYGANGGSGFSICLGESYLSLDADVESGRVGNFGGVFHLQNAPQGNVRLPQKIENGILYVDHKEPLLQGCGTEFPFDLRPVYDPKTKALSLGEPNPALPYLRFLQNAYIQLYDDGRLKGILITNLKGYQMNTDYAIDTAETVTYRGQTYYLRIRTMNVENPVVLFLHGGCGSPDRAQVMKYQSPLADDFTLVAWDQRGAGLAYNEQEAKTLVLTKEIYVEDAHNVACYLKERFRKENVIVVGHSFGSVLGVWLADTYPQDVAAYVGVGQCIDYIQNEKLSYLWTMEEAKRIGDKKSVKTLLKIGYPEHGKYSPDQKVHQKALMKQRAILHKFGGATYSNRRPYWQELLFHELPILRTEYTFSQLLKYIKGLSYSPLSPLAKTNPDFINTVKSLNVPVYLLLGRHDYNCPVTLAEQWFEQLSAPEKQLAYIENAAHSPQWETPDEWNTLFRTYLRKFQRNELETIR